MSDFQTQVNAVVGDFVAQIAELARRAAMETLQSAFGAKPARSSGGVAARAPAAPVSQPRGRGAKRSPEDLEALCQQFAGFVKANPGLRIEQINKQLGTSTKELALPIRKLISEGKVSSKGSKRSTTYFPGRKMK